MLKNWEDTSHPLFLTLSCPPLEFVVTQLSASLFSLPCVSYSWFIFMVMDNGPLSRTNQTATTASCNRNPKCCWLCVFLVFSLIQSVYHPTLQCFYSRRSLYLALYRLTDGANGVSELEPWLRNVKVSWRPCAWLLGQVVLCRSEAGPAAQLYSNL